MNRFTKLVIGLTAILSTLAALLAAHGTRAQEVTIQPFTATEIRTNVYSPDDGTVAPPFPHNRYEQVMVRADGSFVKMFRWPYSANDLYIRNVWDATAKREFTVDDVTQSIVEGVYREEDVIHAGDICEGTPLGQMQSFDVRYIEDSDSSPSLGPNVMLVHKKWNAPKLGCYAIKGELLHMHGNHVVVDATIELANIHLGDPDPKYFAPSTNYATRTAEAWRALVTAAETKARQAGTP